MSDIVEQLQKVRKLQSRAATAKMELHDLAEDLPVNWPKIKTISEKTFEAFAELNVAKKELAALEDSR
ncbi:MULTISPECIES: CCE_0567 family metalloprotein [Rhizobium]|uniref:CCE_0567 family metalloprotein n=1 Tax=Rhizobium TaxID=379 RepID=UPI00160D87E2|nr:MULTISPECIES: CCE_0567 family metalloprotein [Rhizobium]MDK4743236.1 CCE_0567 family metalloprotein [Rhizobium sp. CNPSo 3464]